MLFYFAAEIAVHVDLKLIVFDVRSLTAYFVATIEVPDLAELEIVAVADLNFKLDLLTSCTYLAASEAVPDFVVVEASVPELVAASEAAVPELVAAEAFVPDLKKNL
jgi:hypothetical protein